LCFRDQTHSTPIAAGIPRGFTARSAWIDLSTSIFESGSEPFDN
jgi:hypothetical protein